LRTYTQSPDDDVRVRFLIEHIAGEHEAVAGGQPGGRGVHVAIVHRGYNQPLVPQEAGDGQGIGWPVGRRLPVSEQNQEHCVVWVCREGDVAQDPVEVVGRGCLLQKRRICISET